jgi:hypothetical protein
MSQAEVPKRNEKVSKELDLYFLNRMKKIILRHLQMYSLDYSQDKSSVTLISQTNKIQLN